MLEYCKYNKSYDEDGPADQTHRESAVGVS